GGSAAVASAAGGGWFLHADTAHMQPKRARPETRAVRETEPETESKRAMETQYHTRLGRQRGQAL
ncbi:MAG TPA: hypothetical protein VER04_29725, partial [Polyangiaceae bacterium]|nr:hypothetical protein [Polyangiaceae bacterium]